MFFKSLSLLLTIGLSLTLLTACPGESKSGMDAGDDAGSDVAADSGMKTEIDSGVTQSDAGATEIKPIVITEAHEHDLGHLWIGAGQPNEARLRDLVAQGARIISLRNKSEEVFDEEALILEVSGEFTRYPTMSSQYNDKNFRKGMFDLFDAEKALGGHVYLHCASSNRVGTAWGLYHGERLGASVDEAVRIAKAAGMKDGNEALVREVLNNL